MRIINAARDLYGRALDRLSPERMSAADEAQWAQAGSLDDLCALTVRWLTGDIASQPGYCGRVDVDEDDASGLTDTLIALNRAGMLTNNSQAGWDGPGYDGAHWQQYAAVDGFANTATVEWLCDVTAGTGLVVRFDGGGQPVTFREGEEFTWFGRERSGRDLRDEWTGFGICGVGAVEDVVAAFAVVVFDPAPGRNDRLWPLLRGAAERRAVAR